MNNLITPQRLNALLEEHNLAPLEPAQVEVLLASIPRPYAQSLIAGLQQHDASSIAQIRAWTLTLNLHERILVTISNQVALSNVYAACKLKTSKLIRELLTSAEQGDSNALGFLREHLADGYRAIKSQGLPAVMGLATAPMTQPGRAAAPQSREPAAATNGSNIASMPPPDDGDDWPAETHREEAPQQARQQPRQDHQQHPQRQQPQRQEQGQQRGFTHQQGRGQGNQQGGGYDSQNRGQQDRGNDRRVADHPTRNRQHSQGDGPRSRYDQKAAYGRDTAIQFERCVNNQGNNYTVNIAIAKATGGSTRGGVNWNDKIIMMLTPKEVQLILAVLRGFVPKVRFAGHGQGNDKWMEVEETSEQYAGAIRFTIARGKETRRVNVGPDDVGEVMSLFFRAAQDQLKQQDGYLVDLAIRRAADLHMKQQANKPQRPQGPQGQGGGGQGRNDYPNRRQG